MPEYRVTWTIEVDADSPKAAAEYVESYYMAERPEGFPNVFEVENPYTGTDDVEFIEVVDGVGRPFDNG